LLGKQYCRRQGSIDRLQLLSSCPTANGCGGNSLRIAVYCLAGLPTLRLTKRQWLIVTIMALTGITLNQICFIGRLARTSVTHTRLIQAIGPIMVLLLSTSMRIAALTSRKVLGMTLSFVGVALLLIERRTKGSGANWLGDLILVAACGFSLALSLRISFTLSPWRSYPPRM